MAGFDFSFLSNGGQNTQQSQDTSTSSSPSSAAPDFSFLSKSYSAPVSSPPPAPVQPNVVATPHQPNIFDIIGNIGKGIWGGIQSAAQGYKQDGSDMLYAAQKEAEARDARLGITPVSSGKSYLDPTANSADLMSQYNNLQQKVPYQPTDTAGKVGSFIGNLVGNAPALAVGGATTEGIAQNIIDVLGPTLTNKLAPALIPYVEKSIQGAAGLAPLGVMESRKLQDIPWNVVKDALMGAALGPVFHGVGEGIKSGVDYARFNKATQLPELQPNPLQDVQNQYRNPNTLRDVKAQQLANTFADTSNNLGQTGPTLLKQGMNLSELLQQKQADAQSVFGQPRDVNKYSFTTSEQRAFQELQDGIHTAQNYVRHTDVLAPYPPGTTVEQAYADVKANTGVDVPQLMANYEKAQKLRTSLNSQELQTGRAAGVIPDLKPRDTTIPQPNLEPQLHGTPPEKPQSLQWTNKDQIPKAELPYRSLVNGEKVQPKLPPGPGLKTSAEQPKVGLPEPQSKIIIGKQKDPFSFKNALNNFYTKVVNTQQPIINAAKVAGSDMGKLASNTKNVSGIVDHNFLTAMADKNGDKVGDSLKSTVEVIPKGQEKDFWTYMSQRHNIDRAREGKPVQASHTPNESAQEVKIAEQVHPEYKAIGDSITNWIDKFMQTWGVDTGIVNKDIYDGLRETYKSYFPTQRDFSELEKSIPEGLTQKFADQRTPIRKATGSSRDIINPTENIMNLVNRTIRTAKYNEVGQSLLDTVREAPEKMKQFAEVIPAKDGMFANTDNIITVLENGKPTYLKINNKPLLDAMNGLPKSIGELPFKMGKPIQLFKDLITQKNPIFALRNISRDIPTAYAFGSEPNLLKFGKGLVGAGKDILTNGPRLQKYQAVGGGGSNFFSSGDVPKSVAELMGNKTPLKEMVFHPLRTIGESMPVKAIEKFNNLTEAAPRLAEFNRVLDKTGDVTKALYASNEVTVNFSRGGNITKNIDKGVPYLNAGVQGLDRFVRSFASPKTAIATIIKSGVAVTTPTLALYLVNKDNPHYQAEDNRTKDTYFLIPNITDKDQNGNAKTFIKIPKSRELGVLFSSLFERGIRAAEGQKEPFKGFGNSVANNFFVQNPITQNIAAPLVYNLATNKDFANRSIVPQGMLMDKRSPYLQYDDKTTSIAKEIGKLTTNIPGLPGGLSPKQLDYLVKSYTGIIGQFGIPLLTPGGSPLKALKQQFISDPTFSNQTTTDFYDKLDKLSAVATDKNILQKIPSKTLTPEESIRNSMNGVSSALSRGNKLVNKIQSSNDTNKDAQINAIKTQMLYLMGKANSANDPRSMQQVENSAKKLFTK